MNIIKKVRFAPGTKIYDKNTKLQDIKKLDLRIAALQRYIASAPASQTTVTLVHLLAQKKRERALKAVNFKAT